MIGDLLDYLLDTFGTVIGTILFFAAIVALTALPGLLFVGAVTVLGVL